VRRWVPCVTAGRLAHSTKAANRTDEPGSALSSTMQASAMSLPSTSISDLNFSVPARAVSGIASPPARSGLRQDARGHVSMCEGALKPGAARAVLRGEGRR
jgi:hypothetical protein